MKPKLTLTPALRAPFPRRKSARLPLQRDPIGVYIRLSASDSAGEEIWVPAQIVNLSLDGIGVLLDRPVSKDSLVQISIHRNNPNPVLALCAWNHQAPNPTKIYRVGFHFISETIENREATSHLIRAILSEFSLDEILQKAIEIFEAGQAVHREMRKYLDDLLEKNLKTKDYAEQIKLAMDALVKAVESSKVTTPEVQAALDLVKTIERKIEGVADEAKETEEKFFPQKKVKPAA
jgi:hypothetical protein